MKWPWQSDKQKGGITGVIRTWINAVGEGYMPNWFQLGGNKPTTHEAKSHAAVYACVNIISQEVARLRINVWRDEDDGSRTMVGSSNAALVLNKPNHYQTRSDFFIYMLKNLLFSGDCYAYAERNQNGRILKLHPRPAREVEPWIVPETGDIFYSLVSTDLDKSMVQDYPERYLVPARDVLHVKIGADSDPLHGETPLTGLQYSIPQGIAIQRDSTSFFGRMSRPSGVLKSPNKLGPDAAKRLKEQWEAGMADNFQGRTAVLDNGMEWQPLTMSAADAELIAQYKMTVEDIAMVYRVPLYMLGDMTKATYTNVESQQKGFQAGCLGFYTEHFEAALDQFFDLQNSVYTEFDMERGIVRTEFASRMEGLSKAVTGGLMTINEARKSEKRGPVEGGDDTFLQRQNWPLDLLGADAQKEIEEASALSPGTEDDDDTKRLDLTQVKGLLPAPGVRSHTVH
jgi:HK97 family phage portal protein